MNHLLRCTFFLIFFCGSHFADSGKAPIDQDPAIQFFLQLQTRLEAISPEYADTQEKYREHMREALSEARRLNGLWRRKDIKNRQDKVDAEAVKKEAEVLLLETLEKTQRYLDHLSSQLAVNRDELVRQMLPAEEGE